MTAEVLDEGAVKKDNSSSGTREKPPEDLIPAERSRWDAINLPLIDAGVAQILRLRNDAPEFPRVVKTERVIEVGTDYIIPVMTAVFGRRPDGSEIVGGFMPLAETEERHRKKGGMQIAIVDLETRVPSGEIHGRVKVNNTLLEKINSGLESRDKATLPTSLAEQTEGDEIAGVEFIDNGKFYSILELDMEGADKRTYKRLVLFNPGKKGFQGEVDVLRFVNGDFGFVEIARPLRGGERRLECARGFTTGAGANRYKELKEELGLDADNESAVLTTRRTLQDPATDAVTPEFTNIDWKGMETMANIPENLDRSEEELENIFPVRLTSRKVFDAIKSGEIQDAHTLPTVGSSLLRSGNMVLNPDPELHFERKGVVLASEFMLQTGQVEEGKLIPRGPVNTGEYIGTFTPDSGKTIIDYSVNLVTPEQLDQSGKYQVVAMPDLIAGLTDMTYDIVTATALIKGLINQGVLVYKDKVS